MRCPTWIISCGVLREKCFLLRTAVLILILLTIDNSLSWGCSNRRLFLDFSITPSIQLGNERDIVHVPLGFWGRHGCHLGVGAQVLASQTTEKMYGLQMAGLMTWNTQEVVGIQVAGLFNRGAETKALSLALAGNFAHDFLGVQAAMLNRAHGLLGLQLGLFNESSSLSGLQMGGFNTVNSGDNFGAQLGPINLQGAGEPSDLLQLGLWNVATSGNLVQLSPLQNKATKADFLLQVGVINLVDEHRGAGLQIGAINHANEAGGIRIGLINSSHNSYSFEVALLNLSSHSLNQQIGLINIGGGGRQLGLINISTAFDTIDTLQIGALNIASGCLPMLLFNPRGCMVKIR